MNIEKYTEYLEFVMDNLTYMDLNKKRNYIATLNKIKQRAKDPNLNVALIGDFSSGKSTFINAFLQKDLLKTAWLATTAIPTNIFYSDDDTTKIIIYGNYGRKYDLSRISDKRDLEMLLDIDLPHDEKSIIATLSATNQYIKKIKKIDLYVHSFNELKNICIIDTPGVNPGDEGAREHVKQTQNVLRDYADTTIILYQSQRILTNSFSMFLEENASHFMNDAVFVITMMDLVDADEREELIDYAKKGIHERFHIREPQVFCCSAVYAEPTVQRKTDNEDWRRQFDDLRDTVLTDMRKKRTQIIENQLSKLLKQLIEDLKTEIVSDSELMENKLRILKENSIENLEDDMEQCFKKYDNMINKAWKSCGFKGMYNAMFDDIITHFETAINGCTAIRGSNSSAIDWQVSHLSDYIKEKQEGFSKQVDEKMQSVSTIVQEYYEENAGSFLQYNVNIGQISDQGSGNIADLNVYSGEVGQINYHDSDILEVVGAVGGLALGVACIPIGFVDVLLGTEIAETIFDVYGSVCSGFVNLFGNLNSRKERAIASVRSQVDQIRDDQSESFFKGMTDNEKKIKKSMREVKEKFSERYREIYSQKMTEFNTKKSNMEAKIILNKKMQDEMESYLVQLS